MPVNPAMDHTNHNVSAEALRGASLAFHKNKPPPPSIPPSRPSNGALTAALSAQSTGGSTAIDPDPRRTPRLGLHQQRADVKSPSFIAATLAASRSGSPSPKAKTPRRRGSVCGGSVTSDVVDSESIAATGSLISMFEGGRRSPARVGTVRSETSVGMNLNGATITTRGEIPPVPKIGKEKLQKLADCCVSSKLEIKEERSSPSLSKQSKVPGITNKYSKPELREDILSTPPKITNRYSKPIVGPLISPSLPNVSNPQAQVIWPSPNRMSQSDLRLPATPNSRTPSGSIRVLPMSSPDPRKRRNPIQGSMPQRPLTPPSQRQRVFRQSTEPQQKPVTVSLPKNSSPKPKVQTEQPPTAPKPRGLSKVSLETSIIGPPKGPTRPVLNHKTSSSNDVFVSAPTSPENCTSPPRLVSRHRHSAITPPSPKQDTPLHRRPPSATPSSKHVGLDSLASAIMAGSLAQARLTPHNTGPSIAPPALPTRQRSPRLRQTLRRQASTSSDDSDRHRKGHRRHKLRSGKHAHHEGSRNKWRDEIRLRERKRYEALWASNRGILLPKILPSSSTSGNSIDHTATVINVVVRVIWKRSRLPEDELAEVWDLVDRDRRGALDRQEFVVGMWLIDQRLKGRKIPTKVSESVWGSAHGNGITVMRPGKGR